MRRIQLRYLTTVILAGLAYAGVGSFGKPQAAQASDSNYATFALRGTTLLTAPITDAIREEQRQQIIRYFTSQIAATPAKRDALWRPDFSSLSAYKASVEQHRLHLRQMLGFAERPAYTVNLRPLPNTANLLVAELTLPTEGGYMARALFLSPRVPKLAGAVIAVPPADKNPAEFAGLVEGAKPAAWLEALLARNIAVAIPITTARTDDNPICVGSGGRDRRRVLWRVGFIVGRTLVTLEVEQAMLLHDFLSGWSGTAGKPVAIMGQGDGGMTALYAGALDEKLLGVASIDYFQQRENCWQEPVNRMIYGQLNEFGDAEVAALIAPRPFFVANSPGSAISQASVSAELTRARRFYKGLKADDNLVSLGRPEAALEPTALKIAALFGAERNSNPPEITLQIPQSQIDEALNQHFEAWFAYLQKLIAASAEVRKQYWQLETTPAVDRQQKSDRLRKELGHLEGIIRPDVPMNPRTKLIAETDKFLAYDVMLGVVSGVELYGQLLVPRAVGGDLRQRLPAVVCQHGFDGSPKYITGVGKNLESNDHFYHRFGQRLAEQGYVVFAPYLTVPEVHTGSMGVNRADLINPLVQMALPLGLMRTSIELAKLHRVVDFLQSLPFVDANHIGYYGLSYGGYSATWMPPLEPRLRLTIISAFFNDWQTMLTDSTRQLASYWTLPDEDFYNWNVLNRFVHTQMIAAMWPRPVCVEYGNADQVTTPAWHQRAWKEVIDLYGRPWGMMDKLVNDDFEGPHSIHGIGTFSFLDRWLRPNRPAGRDYGCDNQDYCYRNLATDYHGYDLNSYPGVQFATRLLDASPTAVIRGTFYVTPSSPEFSGMAVKLARSGNPGNLIVRLGTQAGSADLGTAEVVSRKVYPQYDLWYEAALKRPVRLDPTKLYHFELRTQSGNSPGDGFVVFGPQPLGGQDFPTAFGLSFRTLTPR